MITKSASHQPHFGAYVFRLPVQLSEPHQEVIEDMCKRFSEMGTPMSVDDRFERVSIYDGKQSVLERLNAFCAARGLQINSLQGQFESDGPIDTFMKWRE